MDYKNTLNLPRTDFPMKADLVNREPPRLEKWAAMRLYEKIQAARAPGEKFVLHDGPPFANGDVHIGNALNKILKDIIVKYHTLRGRSAPYVPGWDCHGLPIEFKVTQDLRKSGDTAASAATIRQACEAYARKFIDIQRAQFKRLGVLGDWDHPYLTLDKEYEADELRLFADIVERGFVYRGKKPIYWCIPCRTALAEAEVEYREHVSQSVYVRFPVVGHPHTSILIWTTTPWTLPANLAVAYNSTFSYSQVRAGGETFIVSTMLLPAVAAKCGWEGYEIIRSLDGDHLSQVEYQHPFCKRTGKFFAGDTFVDNATGTGFVHIAPGHGLDDYLLGVKNQLPIYSPVDDDGRFAYTDDLPKEEQMPADMIGKSILEKHGQSEANAAVLHELRVRNALVHQENYHHSYPHCWRSKTPIIFRAMDQWFIKIDHERFRETALAAIDKIAWVPDWARNRIEALVKSRPDWCISRQRAWGVPLPAFYDAQGRPMLDAQIVRAAADLIEKHGSNIWFEKTAAELWSMLRPKGWQGAEALTKSNDTLDVWIDSGSSSRAVLKRQPELLGMKQGGTPAGRTPSGPEWQADLYLEGSDQHRGWFQSSLLLSLAGNGAAPFRTVLTHGFMVDADREKISKSKQVQGTYEKPQTSETYIKKYGADVVRLWVASQDFRNDIIVSEERINKVGETYRVIRNALRYQLSNLYDFDPAKHSVPDDKLTLLDRDILARFWWLEQDVMGTWRTFNEANDPPKKGDYDRYEFHAVYQRISQFIAVDLSAIYHDQIKDRLYTDAANSARRRSTQTALHRLLTGLCQMLSPILAFTADEAWELLPGAATPSVHESQWEPKPFELPPTKDPVSPILNHFRYFVLRALEEKRQAKIIGKSLEAKVVLWTRDLMLEKAEKNKADLMERLGVSQLEIRASSEADPDPDPIVEVYPADGQKCERCWHWETDVGSNPEHPTICGRCVAAVKANLASG